MGDKGPHLRGLSHWSYGAAPGFLIESAVEEVSCVRIHRARIGSIGKRQGRLD